MIAVTLYDALARAQSAGGDPLAGQLSWVAEKLVAAALSDLERVGEYERQCFTGDWHDAGLHGTLTRSIHGLYQQWAAEAEQVLERVRGLTTAGTLVARASELDDAYWRVRARLGLSPEQIERATEQARRGEMVPAEELRNELRARLRA